MKNEAAMKSFMVADSLLSMTSRACNTGIGRYAATLHRRRSTYISSDMPTAVAERLECWRDVRADDARSRPASSDFSARHQYVTGLACAQMCAC